MKQKARSTLISTSRPITQQLVNLSNDNLSGKNKQQLSLIIDHLFDDLELGHSCTRLSELISQYFNGVSRYVIQLLQQSNLVAIFKHVPENLIPLPITLLELPDGNHLLFITKYLQYELSIARKIKYLSLTNIHGHNQYNQDVYSNCLSILEQTRDHFDMPNTNQFLAIKNSIQNKISFITGGPGTGKTTTVVLLLWLMYQLYGSECKINICAPTGRAAKRVKDSILNSIGFFQSQNLPLDLIKVTQLLNESNNFTTIHKLLGAIKNKIHFRHNSDNKLKTEVLIVDESSMVGLALFSKLLNAIDDNNLKHIIFLGDKNQLSSVENGYVFASLISDNAFVNNNCSADLFSGSNYYVNSITELSVSKRSSGDIGLLANAVLNCNISEIESILSDSPAAFLCNPSINNILNHYINMDMNKAYRLDLADREMLVELNNNGLDENNGLGNNGTLKNYLEFIVDIIFKSNSDKIAHNNFNYKAYNKSKYNSQNEINYRLLFDKFNQQSLLCATNVGLLGALNLNQQIERKVKQILKTNDIWYIGRPILILENDYLLGLNNGDIGICVIEAEKIYILFDNGKKLIPEVLPKYQLGYAISIHKSQGSEYEHVNIVLPNMLVPGMDNLNNRSTIEINSEKPDNLVLFSRELIYTAITRAKQSVTIFSTRDTMKNAVNNVTSRRSGLSYLI